MKKLLILTLLMLAAFAADAQRPRYNFKRAIVPASLSFVSGASWGLHEVTAHHFSSVQAKHPGINPQFWNPAESWKNKYIGGNPELGRTRFAGVIIPAHITDAKHITASIAQGGLFVAGATITIGKRRPWWHYALDVGISFAAYTAGNAIMYNKGGLMR